jgi:cytochrome d ubiquinol oxidase subunit II
MVIVSVLSGTVILALVWTRRFSAARFAIAIPIAAVIAGWALARQPTLLPGLTVDQAAAPHDALVCLVVAVLAGGAVLFPSLGLLFRLFLVGRLHPGGEEETPPASAPARALTAPGLSGRLSVALLIVGIGLLNAADAAWAHAVGVISLLAFIVVAFATLTPRSLAEDA